MLVISIAVNIFSGIDINVIQLSVFPFPFLDAPTTHGWLHCKYSLTRTKHRHELSMFLFYSNDGTTQKMAW